MPYSKKSLKVMTIKHPLVSDHSEYETRHIHVGFEVLTAVSTKTSIFWNITQCSPLKFKQGPARHLLSSWYLAPLLWR
jgi:hypothetical protein